MQRRVVSITVDAPAQRVFDVVHDYSIRTAWDTLLRSAEMQSGRDPGKDEVAVCSAHWYLGGLTFRTRYVTFNPPDLAAVTLVKPYFIFRNWSASIRHRDVEGSGGAASEVVYTLNLQCRPTWLARPMEAVACRLFGLETQRRLVALKRYVEGAAR